MMDYTNKTISKAADCVTVQLGNDTAFFDAQSGKYFVINDVGTAIWELINGGKAIDELIDRLTADYDVSDDVCASEVTAFLDDMIDKGFIEAH